MAWLKIDLPKFKIRETLSSPPRRYWNKFLFFLVLLVLSVLFFDGWVFSVFSLERPEDVFVWEAAVETLDKNAMGRVFELIDQKATAFERFLKESGVEDPS
ncbi:MAG: hypothetical protein Q8R12_02225 [bacterium]|nr:hypothetical protein [bacterium]